MKCIEYLGNKCSVCGKEFGVNVYTFHNLKQNGLSISSLISRNLSFDKIKPLLNDYKLMCGNCQAELLYNEDLKIDLQLSSTYYIQQKRHEIKDKTIKYLGGKCAICGYDKCKDALVPHHLNSEEKEFAIGGDGTIRKWEDIQKELDKCQLLCVNCHRKIHSK